MPPEFYTEADLKKVISIYSEEYKTSTDEILKELNITPVELPSDEELWKWWQTQKFQKEQGEQEYTMLYEIDLPKILKAFIEHFSKTYGGNNEQQ
jgi:hypothetical protein